MAEKPQNYCYWFRHYVATFGEKLFQPPG